MYLKSFSKNQPLSRGIKSTEPIDSLTFDVVGYKAMMELWG